MRSDVLSILYQHEKRQSGNASVLGNSHDSFESALFANISYKIVNNGVESRIFASPYRRILNLRTFRRCSFVVR